jgi:hypothetical protein
LQQCSEIINVAFSDGYYSSESNKYLVYENSVRPTWTQAAKTCSSDQLEALKSALAIGRILGRVLILPRFHCVNTKAKSISECPLNSLISIAKFDSEFKSFYRESSFLHHRQVPDAVRRDVTSQLPVADRKANGTDQLLTLTSEELTKRFGAVTNRTLRLESLYSVQVKFVSREQQQAFDLAIKIATWQCDYRQLKMLQT